jgi:nucleoporin SEH1
MMIAATHRESENHFSLSWCTTRTLPPMLVVGCGKENAARIYQSDMHGKWQHMTTLKGHNDMVLQVAWAPNLGK